MYVTREVLEAAERLLGVPQVRSMQYEITPAELAMIRASQKHGRAHDVTTFMFSRSMLLVIAKHNYPPNIFRVPGGGLQPGEPLIDGAVREALEESGLPYTPERYVLRVEALFTCGPERQPWTTHILSGTAPDAPPDPQDTREIREARWIDPRDLLGPIAEAMLATGRPLFAYRVALHHAALSLLYPASLDTQYT